MKLFPTKRQWLQWSLPSKLTAVGTYVGIASFLAAILFVTVFSPRRGSLARSIDDQYAVEVETLEVAYSAVNSELSEVWPGATNSYEIQYPRIIYANDTFVESKINKMIADEFLRWNINLEHIEDSTWSGEFICSYDVVYKVRNLIGLRFDIYWYGTGAAHGNQTVESHNINLENGEVFEFKDLFRSWSKDSIHDLVREKLMDHECDCVWLDYEFEIGDDRYFYLDSSSLIVVFYKYEVACGACGAVEVALPFDEIAEFVNPNGPLSFM